MLINFITYGCQKINNSEVKLIVSVLKKFINSGSMILKFENSLKISINHKHIN